jgi:pimeloyl-ACP methyl ester carboxylesterase
MPIANANGIRICYETLGSPSDPAVLLMRGVGTQLVHWPRELLEGLADAGWRVVVFDNRDSGYSENFESRPTPAMGAVMAALATGRPLAPIYRLEDMAADVVGLLDTLQIRRALLLGLSLGGYVGQILAAEHPQRLRGFVQIMASPAVPTPQKMQQRVLQAMSAPLKDQDVSSLEDHALAVAKASTGCLYPIDELSFRDVFRQARARGVWPGCESRQILATIATGDRAAYCRRIRIPTLVVHGTEDPLVPFEDGRLTAELIPDAEFQAIEGMGHELTPALVIRLLPIIQSFAARTLSAAEL